METKIYRTMVKGDGVKNKYILGRISGALDAICTLDLANDCCYAMTEIIEVNEDTNEHQTVSVILTTKTTEERYKRFEAIVKTWYPDLTFKESQEE